MSALDRFDPVLARLVHDAGAHYGCGAAKVVPVRFEERPFSYLLRVAVYGDGPDSPLSHMFVKIYKRDALGGDVDAIRARVEQDFDTTRRIFYAMLPQPHVGSVPPIASYPDLLALVTEEVQGPTLLALLESKATWLPTEGVVKDLRTVMSRVAQWVRLYQGLEPPSVAITIEALRAYIDHRLRRLVSIGRSFDNVERERILAHVTWLGEKVAPQHLSEVPIHADMAMGNVIVSGDKVVALDFAMATHGTYLHDLTRMHVQLDLLTNKPHYLRSTIRTLQEALLKSFDPQLTVADPLFRLLTLLHRVNHLTTLTVGTEGFAKGIYNHLVRHQHLRWIDEQIRCSVNDGS